MADANTRVLVLGSLPGEVSLLRRQYYANPRNQFWRLVGGVINVDFPPSYEARLARLRAAGIGLWDVVGSARRVGSLDGAIREQDVNPLVDFTVGLPALKAVAFNGGTAFAIGRRELGGRTACRLIRLPSSSSANATSFEHKRAEWLSLRPFLSLRDAPP